MEGVGLVDPRPHAGGGYIRWDAGILTRKVLSVDVVYKVPSECLIPVI